MSDLYDYATDVAAWAEQQAGLLRRRASGQLPNDAGLDWENLAEEIEGVAASQSGKSATGSSASASIS